MDESAARSALRPSGPLGIRGRMLRRARRRARRLLFGATIVLLVAGTPAAIKLRQEDVERIEEHMQRRAEDLTEAELVAAMRRLGINRLELTGEEEAAAERADGETA